MNNILKGIILGLTKNAEFVEDYDFYEAGESEPTSESFLNKKLTNAAAAGAIGALVTSNAPSITLTPLMLQTLIQGEKGSKESEHLLKRHARFVNKVKIPSDVPLMERLAGPKLLTSSPGNVPLALVYNENPYITAHEIGHLQDTRGREELIRARKSPSFLKQYLATLKNEATANKKGLSLLSNEFGTLKALRGLPSMAGNLLNYAVSMPLDRYPALKVILPALAAAGAYAATKDEEDVF